MNPETAFLTKILSAPKDEAPRLMYADWLTEHGQPERAELNRFQIPTTKLKLSPDGKRLLTLHDRSLWVWDLPSFRRVQQISFEESVRDFTISPDNEQIIAITAPKGTGGVCALTSTGHLCDVRTGRRRHSRQLGDCRGVAFVNTQEVAIGRLGRGTGEDRNFIDFCNRKNLEIDETFTLARIECCFELMSIPHRDLLLSLGIGLTVLGASRRTLLHHIFCDNPDSPRDVWEATCLFAHPSCQYAAAGFDAYPGHGGKRICVFDVNSWETVGWYIEDSRYPTHAAMSDDGRFLASVLYGSENVLVHSRESGNLVATLPLKGVSGIAFLPGTVSLVLASTSMPSLAVWDWRESQTPEMTKRPRRKHP